MVLLAPMYTRNSNFKQVYQQGLISISCALASSAGFSSENQCLLICKRSLCLIGRIGAVSRMSRRNHGEVSQLRGSQGCFLSTICPHCRGNPYMAVKIAGSCQPSCSFHSLLEFAMLCPRNDKHTADASDLTRVLLHF